MVNGLSRISIFFFLFLMGVPLGGCSKFLPSVYGEGAVLGQTAEENKEIVYGHIYIALSDDFEMIGGPIRVTWSPEPSVAKLDKQYLTSTFYEYDNTFYITQWTQLDTDKFYFEPLPDETVQRWGNKWQERKFTVSAATKNPEYAQYFDYMRRYEKHLSDVFTVTVYAKRFSGRVLIRVIEFVPVNGAGGDILQIQELYPLIKYETVEIPNEISTGKTDTSTK